MKLSRHLTGLSVKIGEKAIARERVKEREREFYKDKQNRKEKRVIAAVALAVWGMHLGRGGISISSHMIIYHHMPRSNWTNNLHEDLGSGSHFQPRGVNKGKKLVQVL